MATFIAKVLLEQGGALIQPGQEYELELSEGQGVKRTALLGSGVNLAENTLALLHDPNRAPFENLPSSLMGMGVWEGLGTFHQVMETQQRVQAMRQSAEASALLKRMPEKYQDAVQNMVEGTDHENMLINADAWNTHWQSKNMDPAVAAEMLGCKNYQEALDAGTDLVIPTSQYATKLANTEHGAALAPDVRFSLGEMTARELGSYTEKLVAKQGEELQGQAQEAAAPELEAFQKIKEDIRSQLVKVGFEPNTADTKAEVAARMVNNLADRAGVDPQALWDSYRVQMSGPAEGEPQNITDLVLNRLKAAQEYQQTDVAPNGESPNLSSGDGNGSDTQRKDRSGKPSGSSAAEAGHAGGASAIDGNKTSGRERLRAIRVERAKFALRDPEGIKPSAAQRNPGKAPEVAKTVLQSSSSLDDAKALDHVIPLNGNTPDGYQFHSGEGGAANNLVVIGPNGEHLNVNLHPHRGVATIDGIIVPEGMRGQGFGKKVIRRAMQVVGAAYPEIRWVAGETTSDEARLMRESFPGTVAEGNAHLTPIREMMEGRSSKEAPESYALDQVRQDLTKLGVDPMKADTGADLIRQVQEVGQSHPELAELAKDVETRLDGQMLFQNRGMKPKTHEDTGLPLNPDGTVTLYHHTNKAAADKILQSGVLRSAGEPDVYLTTRKEADTGYGDTAVAVRVDPEKLQIDDEFPDGRRDFRIDTGRPGGSVRVGVGETLFQPNDRQERARQALRRSLSPSGQGAELNRRAAEAQSEEQRFADWEAGVKEVQAGDVKGESKRGFIQIGPERQIHIGFLEDMNLSTFFHEFGGHLGFEMLGDLAERDGAPEQIREDYQTLLKFAGADSREGITQEGHEKVALAMEAYLMEGKAPSEGLRGAFQRVKTWMQMVYRQMTDLGVKLKPEVREVFDRMFASDAEIEKARVETGDDKALFAKPEDAGMSKAEFDLYTKNRAKELEASKTALEGKLIDEAKREHEAWWKNEEAKTREEVTLAIDHRDDFQALKTLQAGKLEDGMPIKLDRDQLVKAIGEEATKRIARSKEAVYTREGGMDLDTAAEILGFNSGDQLARTLADMPRRGEIIDRLTKELMYAKHGDMRTDGTIADQALEAVHSKAREERLASELRILRQKQAEVAPFLKLKTAEERQAARDAVKMPPLQSFRDAARNIVEGQSIKDLQPYRYLVAGRQEGRKAFELMGKQDFQGAADAKQKELLDHNLYLEATKAKAEADKIQSYGAKLSEKPAQMRIGKAGPAFLEQINGILNRYEFAHVTNKELAQRQSLLEWAQDQTASGEEVAIDPSLYREGTVKNYRECALPELRSVRDALKNIETIARRVNEVTAAGKTMDFDAAVEKLQQVAALNVKAKTVPISGSTLTAGERLAAKARSANAALLPMEQLMDRLDGGDVTGPWHEHFMNRASESQNKEHELAARLAIPIKEALEAIPTEIKHSMLDFTGRAC